MTATALHDTQHTAMERIVAAYGSELTAYAERHLGDPDAAADVVQEVFVRLWQRRASLAADSEQGLRWFLFRAVRNRVIDEMRGRKRVREAQTHILAGRELPSPIQMVDAALLGRATAVAIRALPERRRKVFTLAHVHGLSHAEVGETMGIAPQTVANHMSLALADLRSALRPFLPAA
jgi:RNA polymerase sigma-70 factor (ECF subfamily)